MIDYTLECTCTACPVQYEGCVDGYWFYFRARWDGWECSFSDTLDHALDVTGLNDKPFSPRDAYFTGIWGTARGMDASHMDHQAAEAIIAGCIALWRIASPVLLT